MVNSKICPDDIINNIGAGLSLIDKNHRIIWANDILANWFQPLDKICNKHCFRIFEQRDHICPGCPTKKVFKTGAIQVSNKRISTDNNGNRKYYQLTVSPIKNENNKVIYALELVQDITQRIVQERLHTKINRKLKRMCAKFSCVNKKLQKNILKLNNIKEKLSDSKNKLEKKYREKNNQVEIAKNELQDIFKVNHTLNSTPDIKKISNLVARLSCELMHADGCVLSFIEEPTKLLYPKASFGINEMTMKKFPILRFGQSITGRVAQSKKPLAIYDIENDERVEKANIWQEAGFKSLLCVPILAKDKVLGIITTFLGKKHLFDKEEIKLLSIFAYQVALAINEAKHNDDIHMNYFNTMHALMLAIEARDPYTRGHTERVTHYSLQIARAMNMESNQIEILRYAAEVHDVGKISIPDSILNKPAPLSPEERSIIQLHPIKGSEMLSPLKFLAPAIPIIRHHHERYDGHGYPDGLEKDKIPLLSRILICADSFDAMTSNRPYRPRKYSLAEAIDEIKKNCGTQFDPKIANLFISLLTKNTIQEIAPKIKTLPTGNPENIGPVLSLHQN